MSSLTPGTGLRLMLPLFVTCLLSTAIAQPAVSVSTNAPLCIGAPELLLFETGGSALSWKWKGPNGFSSTDQNPVITNPTLLSSGLYSVTITDGNGETASASVQATIHLPGAIACNDHVSISLNAEGQAFITPQNVLEGLYDFDFFQVEVFDNQGFNLGNLMDCNNIGQQLTYQATDVCSGVSCWGTLTIEDKLAPSLFCETVAYTCGGNNFDPEFLENELGILEAIPDHSDNCGHVNLKYVDEFHDLPCALPANGFAVSSAWIYRQWTATDNSGNRTTCEQAVFIIRRHLADVHFPTDTTISCQTPSADPSVTGAPYLTEFGQDYILYPNNGFCEMDAGFSDDTIYVCDGTKKIHRTWTIIEDCPDTGQPEFLTVDQLIKIEDSTGPAFICPKNDTLSIDPFTCCALPNLPDIILTDNCSRVNKVNAIIQSFDLYTNDSTGTFGINGYLSPVPEGHPSHSDTLGVFEDGPCLLQGTHHVTYLATDDCGNRSSCSFSIWVTDNIPPVVACDSYTKVALTAEGKAEVFATTFDDGSFDQCCPTTFYARRMDDPDSLNFSQSVWFSCKDAGDTVMVIFRAYDCMGNYNDCMVTVFVEDKIKPYCNPPKNLTIDCASFDPTLASFGFPDPKDNCCMDTVLSSVNYNLFDSICNKGTIVRTFTAFDCAGNSSQCSQRVVVDYTQYYYLKMPDDKIVNMCDGSGNYGEPTIHFEDCELIGISFEDEVFTVVPEGCYRIDRHWKIINWCTYDPAGGCIEIPNPDISQKRPFILPGPVISSEDATPPWNPTITMVNPTDTFLTNYSVFWDQNANCYTYKQMILIFDTVDPVIENCPASPVNICDKTSNNAALWNDPKWWDIKTSSHDLCEGPADLSISATDACTGPELRFRFLLFLDLDNDGFQETVINSFNPPPPGMVYYNNALNANFSGGELRPFDLRAVPSSEKYNFAIHESITGNSRVATLQWKTQAQMPFLGSPFGQPGIAPELPYGHHKIKWLVEDGCTNEAYCDYDIIVDDCKAPTVVCLNGLSVNITADGSVQLWTSDFLQYTNDNCTPTNQILLSIRRSGTGTGFPVDGSGNPITNISFDCSEIGSQPVELWAMDLAGNADYCETILIVQDNLGVCGASGKVSGTIKTESGNGVQETEVQVSGVSSLSSGYNFLVTSNSDGYYLFNSIPFPSDITISPLKDDNPINGVTTFDLVEISKHILGIKPLGSPYKMIAADANHSNSITTFDIIELRKLILGINLDFPNNTSWRFIDKNYEFPNEDNPFQESVPESLTLAGVSANLGDLDFIGIKIGDVNNSVISNLNGITDGRNDLYDVPPGYFIVTTEGSDNLMPGDIIEVQIRPISPVLTYQFTLHLDGFELLDLIPEAQLKAENFAYFPDRKALTVACEISGAQSFRLKLKSTRQGDLRKMLGIGGAITPALVYSLDEKELRPTLEFFRGNTFEVYQVNPNPFVDNAEITFNMPESGMVMLTLNDETGRAVYEQSQEFGSGPQVFKLDLNGIQTSQILLFTITSGYGTGTGKIIRGK